MSLIKEMVRVFIGLKQMSIRRFTSVLKLVDEEESEKLVNILKNEESKSEEEVVTAFREVIFLNEVNTMVSHLKSIKREFPMMSQETYIETLQLILKHYRLPSDNKIGALLKVYNIVRDLRSDYVINGHYILKIYEIALDEYRKDVGKIEVPLYKKDDFFI